MINIRIYLIFLLQLIFNDYNYKNHKIKINYQDNNLTIEGFGQIKFEKELIEDALQKNEFELYENSL